MEECRGIYLVQDENDWQALVITVLICLILLIVEDFLIIRDLLYVKQSASQDKLFFTELFSYWPNITLLYTKIKAHFFHFLRNSSLFKIFVFGTNLINSYNF